jgi:integrase
MDSVYDSCTESVLCFEPLLRLFKRHEAWCAKTSKKDLECKPKVKGRGHGSCLFQVSGRKQDGTYIQAKSLGTRNKQEASLEILKMDGGVQFVAGVPAPVQKPKPLLTDAAESFKISKSKKSEDRQRKLALEASRAIAFLAKEDPPILHVEDVTLPALNRYVHTWTDANTTQITRRENLTAFFRFCVKAKVYGITDNPASGIDAIGNVTPQTDVFTDEELRAIFNALPKLADEYGRTGGPIALQTKAFAHMMRYSGLSIGDVTKLPKSDVIVGGTESRVITQRAKTGKEVSVKVPPFVIDALNAAPHDSNEFFFWSGRGKVHTRSSKWGDRLQKLLVLAGVRLKNGEWTKRSTRSKKPRGEFRIISEADPRWFRHTLARDLLLSGQVTMAELAEILGNTEEICKKYYSKWDKKRQDKVDEKIDAFWQIDPLFKQLSMPPDAPQSPGV